MKHVLLSFVLASVASVTASAHFVFVVPAPGTATAQVILSETLAADAQVDVSLIAGAALSMRDPAGRETPLTLTKGAQAFVVSLQPGASGVVHGLVDLGVMKSGAVSYGLRYHPKTIVGEALGGRPVVVGDTPVELVPSGTPGAVRLQMIALGKPQRDAEITVILPDGAQKTVKTDAGGRTEILTQRGRFGAWARYWELTPGEQQGKAYDQIRHYATLVFEAGRAAPASAPGAQADLRAVPLATLPEATSSFGAVGSDGWLYVYGGHIVSTHAYSTAAVSGRFSRLNLADGKTWESLPGGPPLQGMNLAAHGGKIYRVGGMQPQNKPGEPQDIRSVADVARFDPATRAWETLPPLPVPRSSHDVVVVGNTLIVVGGWTLRGKERAEWPEGMNTLDLANPTLGWTHVAQPFKRRALIAAALDNKLYVLGGFNEKSQVVHGVSIYDLETRSWTSGPDLPGGAMNGFGPAACVLDGRLYVSVDDGGVHRLGGAAGPWEKVGTATPRIVHRLVPAGREILVVGGARGGANSDLIESIGAGR